MQHKLAAIFVPTFYGYSHLMGDYEEATRFLSRGRILRTIR